MKVLVIAPHPDDEVLGCGGTIKKYVAENHDVSLCIVTKAYTPDWSADFIENRKKEIECATKALGIKKTVYLDLPTVKLDTIPQKELNDKIAGCVKDIEPDVVFIPFFGDINKDHKLVSEAAMVALRPIPGGSVTKVYFYEVLSETEWGKPTQESADIFVPNFYEDISSFLEGKLEAMKCYSSELKDYPHPRSLRGIKVLAQKRGTECGANAAEAFVLLREIVK